MSTGWVRDPFRMFDQFAGRSWIALLIAGVMAMNSGQARAVVGGNQISIESAPWTVALLLKSTGQVRCSGVIVDSLHVLTAAHCLYQDDAQLRPDRIVIRAGASNVVVPDRSSALQQRFVRSLRVHPDRKSGADVAVLRLTRALKLDRKHVAAITLRKIGTWRPGQIATLAGFGREDPRQAATGALKQVGERVDPQGSCGDHFLGSPDAALLLCASSAVGVSCYGDSGAGLVTSGPHPTLLGIESSAYGYNCRIGRRDRYIYVGAAEIWRFIGGDASPPHAPRNFGLNIWAVPPRVGEPIICEGFGAGDARTHYVLFVNAHPILSGSRALSHTIRPSDVGKYFTCRGSATNAGGTSVQFWKSTVVKP